jgi:ferredoxin
VPDQDESRVIAVDREQCIGSGMCVLYAPGTFVLDDEARAVAADPPGDSQERLGTAVEACPTGALMMTEDKNHQEGA